MSYLEISYAADTLFIGLALFSMAVGALVCRSLWRMEKHLGQLKEAYWQGAQRRPAETVRGEDAWLRR